jgi:hypothetical protein
MTPPLHLVGLVATLLSAASIPAGSQPDQTQLEAALLALQVRIATHPMACRKGSACIKPPKAIRVSDHDCQVRGTDPQGGALLYCRVTYKHKGGSLAHVKSPNECVALRENEHGWEVALVDTRGRCPGARE